MDGSILNLGGGDGAVPSSRPDLIKDTTTAAFKADVMDESHNQPVLVDFWAPWCGPCKQLGPALEKVVQAAGGKVKLVKMNIDEHPSIAGQLGVQSIPAVFAFVGGQPVDGFMGALPESELKAFIDRLPAAGGAGGAGGQGGADPIAEAMEAARQLEIEGDRAQAMQIYGAILSRQPDHDEALIGLSGLMMDQGDGDQGRQLLERVSPEGAKLESYQRLMKRIQLEEEVAALGDPQALRQRLEADPDDHQARFDLASIENARGNREAAADHLLAIIRKDRDWRDDAARTQLLTFLDAWGPKAPETGPARRRLSSLLFS